MGQLVLMVLGVVLILGMSWGIFVTLRKRQQQQEAQESVERHDPVIASEASQETAEEYHVADPYENQPVVGDVSHVTIEQESLNFDPPTEEDTYANERMAAVAQHALDQQTQKTHQAEMGLSDGEADVMSWNDMIQQNLKVRFGQEKQAKVIEMKQAQAMKEAAQPTPLIVLNVMARRGQQFTGQTILEVLRKHKLVFGKKRIFHAYDAQGQLQFSVASAVEPGYFDLENMHHFATPGLGFFMDVQQCQDPQHGFQQMVDTVKSIAQHLGGDVLDDQYQRFSDASLREGLGKIKLFQQRTTHYDPAAEHETV